ncbi:cation:proton antiporter [Flavobacterium sp. RHBU_24]|uniref:cation:proton antiporter n=1 Tax=Flavobacterium sp. RHBU_24 TaxID=3391185 RepID=UPI0039846F4C
MAGYFKTDVHILVLLAGGIIALLAAVVPVLLRKKYLSAPIIYLIIGGLAYLAALPLDIKPLEHLSTIEYITEFVVLVALANTGLRIKEPFKWKTWKHAARLLAIAMPVTIVAAAFLGWWALGFAPATALLFGALISPTDPVLASELQTSEPGEEDRSQIKLGLTAEAGINDGLAFPFTYLAIHAAQKGLNYEEWIGSWLLYYFFIKIIVGVAVGIFTGWALYKLVLLLSSGDSSTLSKVSKGILSLALLLLPYAVSEIAGGYGFIAVFFAACMFSRYEEHQPQVTSLHDFNEELERFVVAVIFVVTGFFIALRHAVLFDIYTLLTALCLILIVRPAAGYLSYIGSGLKPFQKFVLSFYGIRGIGSIFYLAYALNEADFENAEKLIDITAAVIFFSVLIHGITARMVQKRISSGGYTTM